MKFSSIQLLSAALAIARVNAQNHSTNGTNDDPWIDDPEDDYFFPDFTTVLWDTIPASFDNITWTPCQKYYECGRLLVPADWAKLDEASPSDNTTTTTLALVKLPPRLPGGEQDPEWAGPALINFGGPGGSGVVGLGYGADSWHEYFDGKFSIISWDPRGTTFSQPLADCHGSRLARDLTDREHYSEFPRTNSGKAGLYRNFLMGNAFSQKCNETLGDSGKYMGTAATARDAKRISDLTYEQAGKEAGLINYMGYSYGTLLGMTMATMFPDKVGRFYLEGVADADDYYSGERSFLTDVEPLLDLFYKTCSQQPVACVLSEGGTVSPSKIKARVERLIKKLEDEPLPFISGDGSTRLFTDAHLRFMLYLYNTIPAYDFGVIAQYIAHIEEASNAHPNVAGVNGIYSPGFAGGDIYEEKYCLPNDDLPFYWRAPTVVDSLLAISCSDGKPHPNYSFKDHEAYHKKMTKAAKTSGSFYSGFHLNCPGWQLEAAEAVRNLGAKTKNPILFATTLLDPRTPNFAAHKMSKRFPGSRVLTIGSYGHGSMTDWHTEDLPKFFLNGTMPPVGFVVEAGMQPFEYAEGYIPPKDSKPKMMKRALSPRRRRAQKKNIRVRQYINEIADPVSKRFRKDGWGRPVGIDDLEL